MVDTGYVLTFTSYRLLLLIVFLKLIITSAKHSSRVLILDNSSIGLGQHLPE